MRSSRHRIATLVSGGMLCLVLALTAVAQDNEAIPPGQLGVVVEVRADGNDVAADVQGSIEDVSDETSKLLAKYRTTLKQIDAIDLYNEQMRELLTAQETEMTSLADQVAGVQEVGRSVTPLMQRMIERLEQFVELDVPFLIDERRKRVAELRSMMKRADVTTAGKYRQIMEAYQIENEYGRTIESYRATTHIGDRETTVDFLRFGRIALVYQSLDESESGVWDQQNGKWMPLDASYRTSIRDGLRIARKQAAPDLIRLPIAAATDQRGPS